MGRHSAPRSGPSAAVVAVPLVLVAGTAGAIALSRHDGGRPASASSTASASSPTRGGLAGCTSRTPLAITTTDDMAPVVRSLTDRLEASSRDCVDYTVTTESASVTASGLMSGANETTQVWIPDSTLWAERVTAAAPATRLTMGDPFATSPVVFALPRAAAEQVGDHRFSWSQLIGQKAVPFRVPTPERSTTSLLTLLGVERAVRESGADSRPLQALLLTLSRSTADERELRRTAVSGAQDAPTFPASEQQIYALNQGHSDAGLRAMTPRERVPQLDYRLVTVQGRGTVPAKAVDALRSGLVSADGVAALRKAGFRVGDSPGPGVEGVPGVMPEVLESPKAADADQALRAWVTMSRQTRMLAVIDTSESMKKPAVLGMSRMQLAVAAATGALMKFPDSSQIGLWTFDLAHSGQPGDWVERLPVRPLTDPVGGVTQRAALAAGAKQLTWQKANGTALYDTIWAAYQHVQKTYQPDYSNAIILLTDGRNEDPQSLSEQQLVDNLRRASQDSSRPVRVVLIAISEDADLAALQRIAKAVPEAQAYDARRPENIFSIMQAALTTRDIRTPAQ